MILSVDNLSFYYDSEYVLKDINFKVKAGEILCLMGPNGSGKSTLLDCIMGINTIKYGDIFIDDKNIKNASRTQIARLFSYVPQNHTITFPYTVKEVVSMGRTAYVPAFGIPPKEDEKRVYEAMESVGISDIANRPYSGISGGELRLALLARAICQDTKIILMDEPTAHLDYRNELIFLETVSKLVKRDNITVIMATHAPEQAFYFESKENPITAVFLKKGKITAMGAPSHVINSDNIEDVYGVKARVIESQKEKTILLERSL